MLGPTQRSEGLFPDHAIHARDVPAHTGVVLFSILAGIGYGLALFLPADGFVGFDWIHFFGQGNVPVFYPPWTGTIVGWLNWPGLFGLTLAAVGVSAYKRAAHPLSLCAALLALPLFWTLFLGQLDGLVVLGLLGLPALTPLALIKPQVSIFGFLARRSFLLALLGTTLVSLAIWGFWPQRMFSVWAVHTEGRYVNDIAIGLVGLPLAGVLLWLSRGDLDMLMLAGSFATPYLLPYNLLPIVPAMARLRPAAAVVACALSWLPLSANWLGPWGWWLGWCFVAWLWACLAYKRYGQAFDAVQYARTLWGRIGVTSGHEEKTA